MIHGPYDDQLPQSIVCTRFLISYIVWPSEYIAIEEDAVRPLQGVTVVALEQAVAVPFATRQLADLGARVIKIERVDTGDFARHYDESVGGQSSFFVWLNRGKESLALDIKDPDGANVVLQLLAEADIFVQNLAPGAAARVGLEPQALTREHPRLIACDVSGYGDDGPWAARKAYDLLVQCETGLVSITGAPGAPAKVGISIADIAAGMYAFTGVLTALFARERTGRGQHLAVSLLDALGEWMSAPALMTAGSGSPPRPAGLAHATIAPYGPFPVRDGTVVIAVQNEREFGHLATDVLCQPGLTDDARFASNTARVRHRDELHVIIGNATRPLLAEELTAHLDSAGIANAPVRELSDFVEHPQLTARGRWRKVDTPGGPVRSLLPPVVFDSGELPMLPVPDLGQHTTKILEALGLSTDAIDQLARRDVVRPTEQVR